MTDEPTITIALTKSSAVAIINAVGIALNVLVQSTPAGSEASPDMLALEKAQADLLNAIK